MYAKLIKWKEEKERKESEIFDGFMDSKVYRGGICERRPLPLNESRARHLLIPASPPGGSG